MAPNRRTPNPIDAHVGARIRLRRKVLGLSQQRLAEHLGLTFQQVQKYERGTNRVSASMLYGIGEHLEAPVSYFFEGLTATGAPEAGRAVAALQTDFMASRHALDMMAAFAAIPDRYRAALTVLAKGLAEDTRVTLAADLATALRPLEERMLAAGRATSRNGAGVGQLERADA